jgi:hypothetical protein
LALLFSAFMFGQLGVGGAFALALRIPASALVSGLALAEAALRLASFGGLSLLPFSSAAGLACAAWGGEAGWLPAASTAVVGLLALTAAATAGGAARALRGDLTPAR